MADTDSVMPEGERIRRAVTWMADVLRENPERDRKDVVREAEIRFDLTPKECRFLESEVRSMVDS